MCATVQCEVSIIVLEHKISTSSLYESQRQAYIYFLQKPCWQMKVLHYIIFSVHVLCRFISFYKLFFQLYEINLLSGFHTEGGRHSCFS